MARHAPWSGGVNLLGLVTLAALMGVWEVVVRTAAADFEFLPAPSGVAGAFASLVSSGDLFAPVAHTLRSALVGWVIAGVIGVTLGVWLGLSNTAWRYSMASVEIVRAIPPITLVPVSLLVFGFSLRMELVLIVYAGAWTVLINTIDGVRSLRPELVDVGQMLRMSKPARIRKLILPSAVPSIVVGLRLAMSLSLVLAVVAEMIGNPSGLGNALVRAQHALQPEQMFAYVVTIGILGVVLNTGLRYVSERAFPALAAGHGGVA
ncbi:MAG: ABC transporter permease [Actinomycetota bacterium]|jgi:ABC-type nitrate/sulfonate/bicarbonate transport system permease component